MDKDYLQLALITFNVGKPQWYGWKKDYTGDKRMAYENIIFFPTIPLRFANIECY